MSYFRYFEKKFCLTRGRLSFRLNFSPPDSQIVPLANHFRHNNIKRLTHVPHKAVPWLFRRREFIYQLTQVMDPIKGAGYEARR